MNYAITIENEFKNEYADNKFEETFGRFLSDIKDNIDKDIYEKLSIIENAFRHSEINRNNIILSLSLPFDCKPEDILQEGILNLKNPDLCGRYELETLNMLKKSFELSSKMIYIMDSDDEYTNIAEDFGITVVNIKEDNDIELD